MTFVLAAALIITIIWLLRNLISGGKKSLRQQWKIYGLLAAAVLVLLAVTKKLHVLGLLIAGIVPVIRQLAPLAFRFAPFLQQQFKRYRFQQSPQNPDPQHDQNTTQDTQHNAQTASISTALFHMMLDPNTGAISGTVRQGAFTGQSLDDLHVEDLKQLFHTAQTTPDDSLAVFEAYLQSRFGPTWHQTIAGESANNSDHQQDHAQHQKSPASGGQLTIQEAWDILGLTPGTNKAQIISRHKSLIQKLHPDRGGSTYLAVRINQARDLLLKKSA